MRFKTTPSHCTIVPSYSSRLMRALHCRGCLMRAQILLPHRFTIVSLSYHHIVALASSHRCIVSHHLIVSSSHLIHHHFIILASPAIALITAIADIAVICIIAASLPRRIASSPHRPITAASASTPIASPSMQGCSLDFGGLLLGQPERADSRSGSLASST